MNQTSIAWAALSLAFALGACGDADVPPEDFVPRIVGGVAASAYPEAAMLNMPLAGGARIACSGTLIAPRVVLTAGHCVDGLSRFEVYVGDAMVVSTHATTYDWHEHGATAVSVAHHDLGLVFLDTPIVLATYPTLATAPLADGTAVVAVGRILNGVQTGLAWQAASVVHDATSSGYPLDYATPEPLAQGDADGPVFAAAGHTLVAVHSGAGSGIVLLARVDLLRDWINAQVASHGGAGPRESTAGVVARR